MSTTTNAADLASITTGAPAQRPGSTAQNFLQAVEHALNDLLVLKITTVIDPSGVTTRGMIGILAYFSNSAWLAAFRKIH